MVRTAGKCQQLSELWGFCRKDSLERFWTGPGTEPSESQQKQLPVVYLICVRGYGMIRAHTRHLWVRMRHPAVV